MSHKMKVLAKIEAIVTSEQQKRINELLNDTEYILTLQRLVLFGIRIDTELIEDLLRIQLGRNAHKIEKCNEQAQG
jgi:hypothetical protein